MAIQCSHTKASGLIINGAFHRLRSYTKNNYSVVIRIDTYVSKEDFLNNKPYEDKLIFSIPNDEPDYDLYFKGSEMKKAGNNERTQIEKYLLSLERFSEGTPVSEE